MYNLDFDTMKQVMQEHRKTGHLFAEVPSGIAGMQGPCHIEITLESGRVVSCFIVGRNGQRLTEKDSVRQIARLGRLKWTFTHQEDIIAPSQSTGALEKISFYPRRLVHLEQSQMQSWSRTHRMVFALADGTRGARKIAEMLSIAPELVDKALVDLQAIGVITMAPHHGSNQQNGMNHW